MEHIRQYDWCASEPDVHFLIERELDNCVTERIIKNKFYDPLLSESDTDQEDRPKINWDEVFKKRNDSQDYQYNKSRHRYVPCLKAVPPYPKVSNLTIHQHNQLLKVMCSESPQVLTAEYVLRPTKTDRKMFEELKSVYEAEQKEYIEWAKALWTNSHCVRALRPKQAIESVYEAEYKMKAQELDSFPKNYQLAAQIPFEGKDEDLIVLTHQKDLVNVNMSELPQIEYPDLSNKYYIMKPCAVPEPCSKHPCKFVLPNEKSVTMLPLTEIHRELAQYALEQGAQYIFSEKALRCLIETDRRWNFPLSVCDIIGPDGEKTNVVVMGSDFSTEWETSQIRSYKAYRHLLEFAVIPPSEKAKSFTKLGDPPLEGAKDQQVVELSSDEEDDSLFIDAADLGIKPELYTEDFDMSGDNDAFDQMETGNNKENHTNNTNGNTAPDLNDLGVYSCSCKDSLFEKPPPRSFRKWKVNNKSTKESFDFIVHCSHKAKTKFGEVILEPILEYQIDLGATRMSTCRVKSLALAMTLRRNSSLLTVRVEGGTGEVARYDVVTCAEWKQAHGDPTNECSAIIHSAFSQLQGLLPGNYVMHHEPSHGPNAMLYVARPTGQDFSLQFNCEQLAQDEEAKGVKSPPILEPVLLPYHKSRRILPCAFTPYEVQVAKEHRKPPARQKAPPNAIKWPKKKKKNKKN